jgi:hypothetical protein
MNQNILRKQRTYAATMAVVVVFAALFLSVMTWGNYRYASENPGGNDFLVHYVGTRALVTEGLNPYSDEVALRIQTIAYGRPAKAGEHELRVAYPLYSVIVFLPFALIDDFTLARALWMTALEAGVLMLTVFSIRLARWKINPVLLGLLLIFSLFWYHGLRPLINGNAVVFVALLLVGGFLALRAGADELAGVLFALSTIKPQVVLLVLVFVVLWGMSTGRWRMIGWLVGTVILLAAAAALLIPEWFVDNLREVMRYPAYNPPGTPRAAFIEWWPSWGSRLGWALTGVMAIVLLVEWGLHRKAEFRGFLWTAYLTLAASQWIGIQTDPGNFIVLFPVLILVLSLPDERWRGGGKIFVVLSLIALFVGIWAVFLNTVAYGDQPVQSAVMFFPLPAFLLLTLYWVRWWAIQPSRLWFDSLDL